MNPTVSKTIFHFTGIDHKRGVFKDQKTSLRVLLAILHSKAFKVGINKRKFVAPRNEGDEGGFSYDFQVPMVCFTETPFDFVKHHTRIFGPFGLGMNLEWAIRNGAQNVIYCDSSNPNPYLHALYQATMSLTEGLSDFSNGRGKSIGRLVASTEEMGYRGEREWRFISDVVNGAQIVPDVIKFDTTDVEHIICPKEHIQQLQDSLIHHGLTAYPEIQATEDISDW